MLKMEKLTRIEKGTLDFLKEVGEIQTSNIRDKRMVGAIATLKNKGLVEIYRRYTSRFRRKKKKFVRVKAKQDYRGGD
jgi:hypothetical protein